MKFIRIIMLRLGFRYRLFSFENWSKWFDYWLGDLSWWFDIIKWTAFGKYLFPIIISNIDSRLYLNLNPQDGKAMKLVGTNNLKKLERLRASQWIINDLFRIHSSHTIYKYLHLARTTWPRWRSKCILTTY